MTSGKMDVMANVERLNEYMDRYGCSALVLRSGTNFTYLAGFAPRGTSARHLDFPDSPRGLLVIWPRHGEPALVINRHTVSAAKQYGWIERIETYEEYLGAGTPYQVAAETLKQMGLDRETLGLERTYVSAAHWEEMGRLLPQARLIDCAEMMTKVRWIKTPAEVKLLQEAANILDEAYLEVFSTVREGDTEHDVHGRIVGTCIRKGAEWAHGILNSSRNPVPYGGESDFQFRKGDILRNDYVSYYKGYPGHQSRTVILGKPTDEQKREYRVIRDIYRMTIDRCRVGVKASSIHHFAQSKFREHGYADRLYLVGHSVGPWFHQQEPYFVPSCHVELEEGMVLAVEPFLRYWHLQDMIHVTRDGPRMLSTRFNTDEMFVAG